jgi:triacylglycerol esterase/lipase EstA (alpha/beta hydrolase family)
MNSEIYKTLTGVFWEAVDSNDVLRAQKQHFYSNGLAYSTAIDAFLMFTSAGLCYGFAWIVLGDLALGLSAIFFILIGLICKVVAIPRARQRHLELSAEQLDLLRRKQGGFVTDRFREIVQEWRARAYQSARTMSALTKSSSLRKEVIAVISLPIAVIAIITVMGHRWLGTSFSGKAPPEVKASYVTTGTHHKFIAVIFVHGIFGTKDDTWLSKGHQDSFPQLLASDPDLKDKVDVFAFEYFTPKFGNAPSIVDLADQLRGDLDDNRVFEDHDKIVFLAHSMGGIVVRQYLLNRQDRVPKVPMVFFYATPTNGSEMASIAKLASINPQFRGMVPLEGNDLLQSIQSMWLGSNAIKAVASYCAVEELSTFGIPIVTRSSATSLCNRAVDPISANHIDIVKPTDRTDPRYTRFVSALYKEGLIGARKAVR